MNILDLPFELTADQIERYRRNGHIQLRQVVDAAEMPPYREAIMRTAESLMPALKPLEERDTYGKAFLQIWHLCERDETVKRFVYARRFARLAADLMGVPRVRLLHDQVLLKEPGGGPTPWHQDQYYCPIDTNNLLTMWMPLIDVSEEMGTMSFASGSHTEGNLLHIGTSHRSEEEYSRLIEERGWPVVRTGDLRAGDVSFHSGWVVHRAPGNGTGRMREALTIVYFADGARAIPGNDYGRQIHMGGVEIGALVDSPMNPIVYAR